MDLRSYMKKAGFKGYEFAELTGIKHAVISKHMNSAEKEGKAGANTYTALTIEKATDGEVSRLEVLYPEEFRDCERVEIFIKKKSK